MDKFKTVPTKSIIARIDLEDNGEVTIECRCNFKDDKLQIVLLTELCNQLFNELVEEVNADVKTEDKQSKE